MDDTSVTLTQYLSSNDCRRAPTGSPYTPLFVFQHHYLLLVLCLISEIDLPILSFGHALYTLFLRDNKHDHIVFLWWSCPVGPGDCSSTIVPVGTTTC